MRDAPVKRQAESLPSHHRQSQDLVTAHTPGQDSVQEPQSQITGSEQLFSPFDEHLPGLGAEETRVHGGLDLSPSVIEQHATYLGHPDPFSYTVQSPVDSTGSRSFSPERGLLDTISGAEKYRRESNAAGAGLRQRARSREGRAKSEASRCFLHAHDHRLNPEIQPGSRVRSVSVSFRPQIHCYGYS